jgi:hypothetical protein
VVLEPAIFAAIEAMTLDAPGFCPDLLVAVGHARARMR